MTKMDVPHLLKKRNQCVRSTSGKTRPDTAATLGILVSQMVIRPGSLRDVSFTCGDVSLEHKISACIHSNLGRFLLVRVFGVDSDCSGDSDCSMWVFDPRNDSDCLKWVFAIIDIQSPILQ